METPWFIWFFGLLLPPMVAFVYSAGVLGMYVYFHEYRLEEKLWGVMMRLALLVGAAAITYSERYVNVHGSDFSETSRIAVLAIQCALVWSCAFYFVLETRYMDVIGMADPSVKLLKDNAPSSGGVKNKIVLITGANAGIGKETARQLAELGAAKVILACRSPKRGQAAMEELRLHQKKKKLSQYLVLECDLSDFDSIRKAVSFLKGRQLEDIPQIDLLVLNAGVMMGDYVMTKDGCETTLQANLLGHYFLTRLLLEQNLLKPNKKNPPRVLHLTSSTYLIAIGDKKGMDFEDMMCTKGKRKYGLFGQYAQSKLGNLLFAKEMARRYKGKIISLGIHPGIVRTEVTRNMPVYLKHPYQWFIGIIQYFQKTGEQGAWCTIAGATLAVNANEISATWEDDCEPPKEEEEGTTKGDQEIPNGSFLQNGRVRQTHPYTYEEPDASKLWDVCEKLVGLEQK